VQQSRKLVLMLGVIAAVAVVGWLGLRHWGDEANAATQKGLTNSGPVPVFAAKAEGRDVPIILRGIGAVQAFNTVTVKSRVDGNIIEVAYKEGQFVHRGDLLIQLDPRPFQAALDQAKTTAAKDAANLANAHLDLNRDAAIIKNNLAVTQQQYDTQKALVAADQATGDSDNAAVEAAQVNLDYAAIRSPIDGRTGQRQVDIGNLVQASAATPLVTVTQMKPIFVTFSVPGRDLTRIRQQMTQHELRVDAFDGDDKKMVAEGQLSLVNNQVDQSTGMVTLKATFANDDEVLWPGAFVNAHLILDTIMNGVTVPVAAVQMGPAGAFAYVVKSDQTIEQRKITVTQIEASTALIGQGLQAGDIVVVSGQNRLFAGVKVAVQAGAPGEMNAQEPEIGAEGVGSTGVNTPAPGAGGINPR
jgi:membrane fusion protein, multidrug efflux system